MAGEGVVAAGELPGTGLLACVGVPTQLRGLYPWILCCVENRRVRARTPGAGLPLESAEGRKRRSCLGALRKVALALP